MEHSQSSSLDIAALFQAIKHIPEVLGVSRDYSDSIDGKGMSCLSVFVEKKKLRGSLPAQHVIPSKWKCSSNFTIDVKVVEFRGSAPAATGLAMQDCEPSQYRSSVRPIQAGYSFGLSKRVGTLGMVVRSKNDANRLLFLTSSHVLNLKPDGRSYNIYQPSGKDKLPDDKPIARSHYFTKLSDTRPNFSEAGLAIPIDEGSVGIRHPLGRVADVAQNLELGQQLSKIGRTTGLTQGRIIATDWHGWVRFGRRKYPFARQLLVSNDAVRISRDGDSGSVWLTENLEGAALNFGGANNGHVSISTPLSRIFTLFDLEIPEQD